MSPAALERRLCQEGLAPLDFSDGAGGIAVGNRGSGKVLNSARAAARQSITEEHEQRQAVLHSRRMSRLERRVYALYSKGAKTKRTAASTRAIAKKLGLGRMMVWRMIRRIEARQSARETLPALLASCEPTTIVLVFALLERALSEPSEVREMIGQARAIPEIRALLEPDDYAGPMPDGCKHRGVGTGNASASKAMEHGDMRRTGETGVR